MVSNGNVAQTLALIVRMDGPTSGLQRDAGIGSSEILFRLPELGMAIAKEIIEAAVVIRGPGHRVIVPLIAGVIDVCTIFVAGILVVTA